MKRYKHALNSKLRMLRVTLVLQSAGPLWGCGLNTSGRTRNTKIVLSSMLVCILILLVCASSYAAESTPVELKDVGITEKLGEKILPDLTFINEEGEPVRLGHYFDGKHPVLLSLVYYGCPSLCNLLMNGMTEAIAKLPWTPGEEYRVVHISIDPQEGPQLAQDKKAVYMKEFGREAAAGGWNFLTGDEAMIKAFADQVGFHYRYDEEQKQYAHAASLIALTPQGSISRYLYGIQFGPRDVRLALLEASEGKIGNVVDQLLLYCYHYDPKGRKYALFAQNLMKGAGGVTIAGVVLFIGILSHKRRRRDRTC